MMSKILVVRIIGKNRQTFVWMKLLTSQIGMALRSLLGFDVEVAHLIDWLGFRVVFGV
jgi:hypothetical protein